MQPQAATTPEGHTYKLTLFSSNKDNQGHVVQAASPDDIVRAYENPQLWHNELEVDADTLKDASRAVSAAVFNGTRAKANIVSANVLFLDFDDAYDQNAEQLASELRAEGWLFALHTSTGSQFLDGGRCKLRLVMPLSEAVSAEDYRSVWAEMAAWAKERVGLVADSTKQGAESLMYLPMWLAGEPWQSRWHSWANLQADGAEPYMWFSVAEAPAGGSTYEQHALERISESVQKDAALVKYAFALGAKSEPGSDSDSEIARLWPLVQAALQRAERLPGGALVRDWAAAEAKFSAKFLRGVRTREAEAADAVDALRAARAAELREMLDGGAMSAFQRAPKPKMPANVKLAQRLGKLCAVVDDVLAQRAKQEFERAAERAKTQEDFDELKKAFASGLANAEDLQTEAGRERLGITFLENKEGLAKPCSANIVEMLVKDPLVKQTFARDVRSLDDRLRMRKQDGSCERVHLNLHQGFQWCREVLARKHKLRGVEVKHWSEAVKTVDIEQITSEYDAVREYLDELPVVTDLAAARTFVDTFLVKHAGVEDTEYTRAATRALFVSAVHAALRPAEGPDLMWIFVGSQGLGKTQLLRGLCQEQEWFSELSPRAVSARGNENDQGRKKYRVMSKNWIVEVPEVRFDREDAETWKEFISSHRAYARLSHRQNDSELVRRCVLVATTNDSEVLKDATGNRRFLPLTFTRMVDQDAVRQEREHLWACAYALWRLDHSKAALSMPESLWEATREVQTRHYDGSFAEEYLGALTRGEMSWPACGDTPDDVYSEALGLKSEWKPANNGSCDIPKILNNTQIKQILAKQKAPRVTDLSAVMRKIGWVEVRSRGFRTDSQQLKAWVHPDFQKILI